MLRYLQSLVGDGGKSCRQMAIQTSKTKDVVDDTPMTGGSSQRRHFFRSLSSDASEPARTAPCLEEAQVNFSLESLFRFQKEVEMHRELGKESQPIETVQRKRPNYDNRMRSLLAKQHERVS